ncbi:MAG: antibiotic biosynthesis monooxygenase [Saprospiraceae bacterium]|nr:antibiotic biosynthesis monooxygenase [Saprospiraceae bacterium]MBK8668213.1 antibiotic biosynthesis monooxygenase [Saprospiraceae bacterium]MBL0099315.1 antibiotic biosynthesis monooxygenase [Saprospiraceae bacterium]
MKTITRIVRLSFEHDKTETFLKIFEETKQLIRSFDGCQDLELMQDYHHTNVYYTVSKWQSHEALEHYRHSDLFRSTWAKTKELFNAKASAYSLAPFQPSSDDDLKQF